MSSDASRITAALGVMLSALSLGACAAGTKTTAEIVGYAKDQPSVTVSFWYMPTGENQDKAILTETRAFQAIHPNITVKPTKISWDDALTKLSTASTSGDGPDVTQLGTTWVGGFSALGALRPYTQKELAAVGGQAAFAPASWNSTHLLGSSEITAIPWLVDIRALFYRTDVLAKAGVDAKDAFATWDSLESTVAKIKASGSPVAPLAIGLQNNFGLIHNIAPFIWENGGNLLSDDGTRSLLDQPESVQAVTYYQHLVARYDDPKAMALSSNNVSAAFADGTGAITIDNSASVADFLANPDRPGLKAGWSTAPTPAGKAGRFSFLGGSNLAILKGAKQPEAAFEWVRFLAGKASQQRYSVNAGFWPSSVNAVQGTKLETEPAYGAFRTMINNGRSYPSVPAWITIESVIAKDFAALWHAQTPLTEQQVSAVMTQTSADIDAALKVPVGTGK